MLFYAMMFVATFVCGALYECACVFWVHHSERAEALKASFWSCVAASVTVVGVEAFIQNLFFAAAYVLGFGVGTYITIRLKAWFLRAN